MTKEQAGSIAKSLHFIDRTLRAICDMLENPLREATSPARMRNEAACCGNCPYMDRCTNERDKAFGVCCLHPPIGDTEGLVMPEKTFCGQHPNFWKES